MKIKSRFLSQIIRGINNRPFLLILAITIVVYWPISFLCYSLQHDMLNVVLPWRYFAGECLREGFIPLWNPYQQCGYPIHADLQYPLWYPEVPIVGGLFGYSNFTLHLLFILYVALAGYGMFKLARQLDIDYHYALLTGIVYLSCGIFVGYAQSLASILAATWLPWVLTYYLRLLSNPYPFLTILKLTFFTFLMLSGGYQAVSIMLFYLMLALFLYTLIKDILSRNYIHIRKLFLSHVVMVAILLPLCLGILLSLYYVFPYVERLGGLPLSAAQKYAFTPQSMISFLLPFAAITNKAFFSTDLSMTNAFISVIVLSGALLGVVKRKPAALNILIITGFVFLLASFGKYTPVQKWLYLNVPFLNLFKYPCFYRYYTTMALILMGGYYFTHYCLEGNRKERKRLNSFLAISVVLYSVFIVYSSTKISIGQLSYFQEGTNLFKLNKESSIHENIFIQSVIQLIVLGLFLCLSLIKKLKLKWLIITFAVIELALAAQLNSSRNVYSDAKPYMIKEVLKRFPHSFPVPDQVAVSDNLDKKHFEYVLYLNMGSFTGQVSPDAFTSFLFNGWNTLIDSFPVLRDSMLSNAVLYLSDDLRPLTRIGEDNYNCRTIYIEDSLYRQFSGTSYNPEDEDTVILISFKPHNIVCSTDLKNKQWLTLQQNNYVGWKVCIDGKPVKHYTSNLCFISLPVPAGKHQISFTYNLPVIKAAFWLSMITFCLLTILILYLTIKPYGKRKSILLIGGASLLIILFLVNKKVTAKHHLQKQNDQITSALNSIVASAGRSRYVISIDDFNRLPESIRIPDSTLFVHQTFRESDYSKLLNFVTACEADTLYYLRINTVEKPYVLGVFHHLYPNQLDIIKSQDVTYSLYTRSDEKRKLEQQFLLENKNSRWEIGGKIDSAVYASPPASLYLDTNCVYPATLKIRVDTITCSKQRILSFDCKVRWEKMDKTYIVFHIEHDKRTLLYKSIDLQNYRTSHADWDSFSYSVWLSDYLHKNDIITVYLWKPEEGNCWIDDIKVTIFSTDR